MTSYCDKVGYWCKYGLTMLVIKLRGESVYHLKIKDSDDIVISLAVANDKLLTNLYTSYKSSLTDNTKSKALQRSKRSGFYKRLKKSVT